MCPCLCCSGEPILLLNALHGLTFSPIIGFPHGHVAQGTTQDETTSECTDTYQGVRIRLA